MTKKKDIDWNKKFHSIDEFPKEIQDQIEYTSRGQMDLGPPGWSRDELYAVHTFAGLQESDRAIVKYEFRKIVGDSVSAIPDKKFFQWFSETDNRRPDALLQAMRAAGCMPAAVSAPQLEKIDNPIDDIPDGFGTPGRLKRMAKIIRDSNRRMRTSDLKRELGQDPGIILAPSHGCPAEIVEYAKNHLMDGHGWWKWKP